MSRMLLKRLEAFGKSEEYFVFETLTKVSDHTCLCEEIELIDFDEQTEPKITKETNQMTRSSCDGLYFNDAINFIEFKSFKQVKQQYRQENLEKKERRFIKKTQSSLPDKIESTIWMLEYILHHKLFKITNEEKKAYRAIVKNYYLVVDVNLQENSKATLVAKLNGLSLPSSLYDNLIIQVTSVLDEVDKYIKIAKPKLINCNELKEILLKEKR